MFKLLRSNRGFLESQGSLDTIRPRLPKTVNDAIDLVRNLGEQYLWVDALCLIQDDPDDVRLGIELMNSIYQGSFFTVVAGSGTDANSGLPGVSPGSRQSSQLIKELNPSLKMTILHSIDWHLARSTYNDRGWTLQELVLPRRTVIFINDQVYFRCQEANWSEDSCSDLWTHWIDSEDSNISRIPNHGESVITSFWAYQKLFEDYSKRKLRYDGDALRATAGISRPLAARMCTPMVEGLPGYYLDVGLLWISTHGNLRRRPEFASFSWAGWEGEIMWPRENYIWVEDGRQTWDPLNLLKWFKQKTFVQWRMWEPSNLLEDLAYEEYDKPSRLATFMRGFTQLFSKDALEELDESDKVRLRYTKCDYSSMLSLVFDDERAPNPSVGLKELDLLNSQVELERMWGNLEGRARMGMQNWMASRSWSESPASTSYNVFVLSPQLILSELQRAGINKESLDHPRSLAREWEVSHYRFRDSNKNETASSCVPEHLEDQRARSVRRAMEEKSSTAENANKELKALTSIPYVSYIYPASAPSSSILILAATPLCLSASHATELL